MFIYESHAEGPDEQSVFLRFLYLFWFLVERDDLFC